MEAHNEIGELTHDFNQMAQAVRDHAERLEQRVAERTQELDQAHRQLAAAHQQVLDSIQYAQEIGYPEEDLNLMRNLLNSIDAAVYLQWNANRVP